MQDLLDVLVVFDWNGTIVADLDRAVAATNEVLDAHRLPQLSTARFRETWRLPMASWLHGLGVPPDDLEGAEALWNQAVTRRSAPVRDEAPRVLADLAARGALLGVVSAAGAAAVSTDLERSSLTDSFDLTATAVADKAAHLRTLRHLRETAVYVGDTEYDVHCARQAGYVGVGITGGYRSAAALATAGGAVIDSLTSLVELLPARQPPHPR